MEKEEWLGVTKSLEGNNGNSDQGHDSKERREIKEILMKEH